MNYIEYLFDNFNSIYFLIFFLKKKKKKKEIK